MPLTKGFTDEIKDTAGLPIIGAPAGELLDATAARISQHLDRPLRLYSTFPVADAKLNIGSNQVAAGDSAIVSTPPIDDTIQVYAGCNIDFQALTTGGSGTLQRNSAAWTFPTVTASGKFIRIVFVYNSISNLVDSIASVEAASQGALVNPGTLFSSANGTPVGYIDLVSTSTTQFKTVGSATSIIENIAVYRFGSGSGGSGSGTAFDTTEAFRNMADDSIYELYTTNVFKESKQALISALGGTATYAGSSVNLAAIADSVTSIQLLDSEFTSLFRDLNRIQLAAVWKNTAIDNAATYQVSRDGGANYYPVTMVRAGTSSGYVGEYVWDSNIETPVSLVTFGTPNSSVTLNATTEQILSQAFVLASASTLTRFQIPLSRTAAVGSFYASIVKDSGGTPSLLASDVYGESSAVSISGLGTGNVTASVSMPTVALPAGTYHLVLRTDLAYKSGTMDLAWRNNTVTFPVLGKRYNGTVYSALAVANSQFVYTVEGRALDLRVKVIAGTASTALLGYAIFYSPQTAGVTSGVLNTQDFSFLSLTNNTNSFTLNWVPDPTLLKCYNLMNGQVYVQDNGQDRKSFLINGSVVTFPANTFQISPDQTVKLRFQQTEGVAFDVSSQNASNIQLLSSQQTAMGNATTDQVAVNYLTAVNGTPAAGQFRSTITGRGKMVDPTTDLLPRMGLERIQVQSVMQVTGESGPNGEAVFKPINDKYDQLRFGGGVVNVPSITLGATVALGNAGDFFEISFYGIGLNILSLADANTRAVRIFVDGGSGVDTNISTNAHSSVLSGRSFATNSVVNLASGLSLGLHTIRGVVQTGFSCHVYGFEIINDGVRTTGNITSGLPTLSALAITAGLAVGNTIVATGVPAGTTILSISGSTLTMSANATATTVGVAVQFTGSVIVNPGVAYSKGKALTLANQTGFQYNSGFESGSLGTRGGRVVVYQKTDGTIAKAVQPTNASQLNLTSADHSNEEVIRTYFWREFGAGRTDDFSTLAGSVVARAFTLDDGTATLVGSNILAQAVASYDVLAVSTSGFWTNTFVGTGLDLVMACDSVGTNGSASAWTITVDGGSPVNLSVTSFVGVRQVSIVSGLAYGSHTVKLTRNTVSAFSYVTASFIVYGPKKPTIPTGAMELADYNVMANFVANTTASSTPSVGVIRKQTTREMVFSGAGWSAGSVNANFTGGFSLANATDQNYLRYTGFGTGLGIRLANGDNAVVEVSVNGVIFNTANFGALATAAEANDHGDLVFTASTGRFNCGSGANSINGWSFNGLPLGNHVIEMKVIGTGNGFQTASVELITPIHVHKNNGPFVLQNTLAVGSQGINDGRVTQLSYTKGKHARYIPLAQGSTTSTTEVPMGMQAAIYLEKDELVSCAFEMAPFAAGANQNMSFRLRVDGVLLETFLWQTSTNAFPMILERVVPMTKGWHLIVMHWLTSGTQLNMPDLASGGSEYGNLTARIVGG